MVSQLKNTHLGYLILWTLGLSASWNNNLSSAFSFDNSKCLSFLSDHTLLSGVYFASSLVTNGASADVLDDENESGETEGEADAR